jgi:hypothetical protein
MDDSDDSLKESDDSYGVKKMNDNSFENDLELMRVNGRSFGRSGSFKADEDAETSSPDAFKQERNVSTSHSSKNAEPIGAFKSAKKLSFSKPYEEYDNVAAFRPNS